MVATPLNNRLSGSITARGHSERGFEEDANRALVDKETELGLMQPGTPLLKVEIRAEIALLQKIWAWFSAFRRDFV